MRRLEPAALKPGWAPGGVTDPAPQRDGYATGATLG